jgi:hypothetical protein
MPQKGCSKAMVNTGNAAGGCAQLRNISAHIALLQNAAQVIELSNI